MKERKYVRFTRKKKKMNTFEYAHVPALLRTCYPIDVKLLRDEAERVRHHGVPSEHSDFPKEDYPKNIGWKMAKWTSSDGNNPIPRAIDIHLGNLINDMNLNKAERYSPRFYYLPALGGLPNHYDDNTTCGLNFLLVDDYVGVNIGGTMDGTVGGGKTTIKYSQGLLNTTLVHGVDNREHDAERILLKFSIFGTNFLKMCDLIPDKYKEGDI